jgi:hypothetical protein
LRGILSAITVLAILAGCDGYTPPPAPPDPDPPPSDPLEARIRTRAPTEAPYMIRQGDARHFAMTPDQSASFTIVLPSSLCYKVLAQGQDAVGEVDMLLYSQDGVLIQQDTTQGTGAILGTTRPICPEDPVQYRVEVRTHGAGELATQLYASP